MKRTRTFLVGLCVGLMVLGMAASASAIPLSFGDVYFVGLIEYGIPANPANEEGYISNLITLSAGAGPTTIDGQSYDRTASTLNDPSPLPPVIIDSGVQGEDYENLDVTGVTYLLGKYDGTNAGSLVWYVANLDIVTLPLKWGPPSTQQHDISHYTKVEGAAVPEPTSLLLLGFGLVGLAGARRMLRK